MRKVKHSYPLRTKFANEVTCEFLVPKKQLNKVALLCGGMPKYPMHKDLMYFLQDKGYWVFSLRYRGSWESAGSFLEKSPVQDVYDVIEELSKGFMDLWSRVDYKIINPEVYVIGSSFGGPAAILSSQNPKVKKIVALAPVIDWKKDTPEEPIEKLGAYVQEALPGAFRMKLENWNKLQSGIFYSPIHEIRNLDPKKILLFHSMDDKVVYYTETKKFSEDLGCKLITCKKEGHLNLSRSHEPKFWSKIEAFLS